MCWAGARVLSFHCHKSNNYMDALTESMVLILLQNRVLFEATNINFVLKFFRTKRREKTDSLLQRVSWEKDPDIWELNKTPIDKQKNIDLNKMPTSKLKVLRSAEPGVRCLGSYFGMRALPYAPPMGGLQNNVKAIKFLEILSKGATWRD